MKRPDAALRLPHPVQCIRFILAGLVLLGATGCYYPQAARGHLQLVRLQQPVDQVIADQATSPELRGKLELVLRLREFAGAELELPPGRHYLSYADLGREYVVWNVFAAPEFSLESKSWWYPFIGRQKYRGFFCEQAAQDYASKLREKGWDVYVGGVEAYSTLGWFRDPVLSTFIERDEAALADLIFHELAHQRVFVRGDTEFNEAFAVTVAREGVRRWFAAQQNTAAFEQYASREAGERTMIRLIQQTRQQLADLYAGSARFSSAEIRMHKRELIREFLNRRSEVVSAFPGGDRVDSWQTTSVNNARLNTVSLYHDLVPGFERLLKQCDGDLQRFFDQAKALGGKPKATRHDQLRATLEAVE